MPLAGNGRRHPLTTFTRGTATTTSGVLGPSRTALVTGASRGIRPVIARRLAAEGNHMILTGRSDSDLWRRYLGVVLDGLRADGAVPLRPGPPGPEILSDACR